MIETKKYKRPNTMSFKTSLLSGQVTFNELKSGTKIIVSLEHVPIVRDIIGVPHKVNKNKKSIWFAVSAENQRKIISDLINIGYEHADHIYGV